MPQLESLEKLQRADHDLLIRLETKVDQIVIDIKEVKDGTKAQLISLDQRVKAMEELRDKLAPVELHKMILEDHQWIHDFNLKWKIILGIAGTIGAIVSFLIYLILNIVNLIGRK